MKKNVFKSSFVILTALLVGSCSSDDTDLNKKDPEDDQVILKDSKPSATIPSQGFYVVNEDWFGHDSGTVNYFKHDGSITYRAYRVANPEQSLGVTSQFATIYGEHAYFISKQQNRLVVADAKTLKSQATLTDIGGDGRSFVGVSSDKGYVATSNGVSIFNIKTKTVESQIQGISAETGSMLVVGNYVLTITKSQGTYVINTQTDQVEKLIEGTDFAMITQSKDGQIWIGATKRLIQLDPFSLEIVQEIDITEAPLAATWFAWTAGSLAASIQENALYWTKGTQVVKFDIDSQMLNTSFYALGKDDQDKQLDFYGAGLRVDPLSDKLVLTLTREGWGDNKSYNWVHIVSNSGVLEKDILVQGDSGKGSDWGTQEDRYFWFPAMPFFQDVNAPEILLNQVILTPEKRTAIALNDKIVDADNTSTSILKSMTTMDSEIADYQIKQDSLIVTPKGITGTDQLILKAISNGKVVEKQIRIDIRN